MAFNHIATSGSTTTMGPAPLPIDKNTIGYVEAPAAHLVSRRTDYVVINQTGSYHFLYSTSGSIGGSVTGSGLNLPSSGDGDGDGAEYVHAGNWDSSSAGPIRLEIGVVAWSGSGYDHADHLSHEGDVTFGYKNGRGQ